MSKIIRSLITQREEINQYGGLSDSLEKEYVDYFRSLGITAFPVSNFVDVNSILENTKWNLIILTGGGILPREAYTFDKSGMRQTHRDALEKVLVTHALENDIPLVGICRGMQFINYTLGGKIDSVDKCINSRKIKEAHAVHVDEENILVNNYHDDVICVKGLNQELLPIAIDDENQTVEAFKHKSKRVLGIQWHPERVGNSDMAVEWCKRKIVELLL